MGDSHEQEPAKSEHVTFLGILGLLFYIIAALIGVHASWTIWHIFLMKDPVSATHFVRELVGLVTSFVLYFLAEQLHKIDKFLHE